MEVHRFSLRGALSNTSPINWFGGENMYYTYTMDNPIAYCCRHTESIFFFQYWSSNDFGRYTKKKKNVLNSQRFWVKKNCHTLSSIDVMSEIEQKSAVTRISTVTRVIASRTHVMILFHKCTHKRFCFRRYRRVASRRFLLCCVYGDRFRSPWVSSAPLNT